MHPRMHTDAYTRTGMHTRPDARPDGHRFAMRVPPAFRRGEDVKRSSDPWSRMRGLYNIVKFFRPSCMHCMHLYASRDAYKKRLGKSPKTLIYKGKNKIPFSCMHCMHQYKGFPSLFSNPL